jgi:hypothetical protein
VEVPQAECTCENSTENQIMSRIHERLTCRHYSEIRKLITASRNNRILSEDEKKLFDLAEHRMIVANVSATSDAVMGEESTRLRSMSSQDQREYRAYFATGDGEVTRTTTKKVPRYTFEVGADNLQIITNIEKDAQGLWSMRVNNSRTEFIRLTNPYQATIHELWHNIDYLAGSVETVGRRNIHIPLSSLLFRTLLRDGFKYDFNSKPSLSYFYARITGSKINYAPCNLYYLFDIIEGISHCYYANVPNGRFTSIYASRPDYWIGNRGIDDPIHLAANFLNANSQGENITAGQIKLATEFFAAVGCITSVGDEKALRLVKLYLPKSYDVYIRIVKSAIERMR